MSAKRILLTGAGSGGHVYPLIAVVDELQKMAINAGQPLELRYLGVRDRWSEALIAQGVRMHWIPGGKLRRYVSGMGANILDVPKFMLGLLRALWKMFWLMPDAVFSKGGPGALPVVWAAWFYRVPILIHESDGIPGLTTSLSAPCASRVAISFEAARKYFPEDKVLFTGNPVRRTLLATPLSKEEAREKLKFNPRTPLLLVLGGSQGSVRLNEFILSNLKEIMGMTQVFHQTGMENFMESEKLSRAARADMPLAAEVATRYQAVPFLDDASMKLALAAADLVVARAGSSTLSEIAAFSLPAILVPLPESARDHQRENAYAFAAAGGGTVIEEANLMTPIFLRELREILENSEKREKMQSAARTFFRPDAASAIAVAVWEMTV